MTDCTRNASVHMIKLCVGVDTVEELSAWQARRSAERAARGLDPRPWHVTRMWPKRAEELAAGGSLYWVIRGEIAVRQKIASFERRTGEDGIDRCAIMLDSELVRVNPRPRRPFQGWRYLKPEDAPADLTEEGAEEAALPQDLRAALSIFGVTRS